MVVNVYSVVLGAKKRMQQTFFIFKKKNKTYGRNSK